MPAAQSVDSLTCLSPDDLDAPNHWRSDEHPVELMVGRGSAQLLLEHTRLPALVVSTENSIARSGLAEPLSENASWYTFNGIRPNPTPKLIEQAANFAKENRIETIVGLGGGSALDAARCVSLMLGNSPSIAELQSHIRSGMPLERKVDLIQVPTTAGTGAEVTPWASVWSEEGKKSSVDHPAGFADYAFVDPALTDSMPSRLSVAVGLDAMTHAMESLWGRHGNSFSNTLATRALELLQAELPQVIDAPTQQSRNGMTLGALLAGMALSTTRSAIAHALSYQLTGEHNIEHGLAVGLIALAVFKLPAEEAPQERARVVQACGRESAEELAEFLETNFRNIGMTTSLSRLGVPAEAISAIIKTAIASNRLGNMSGEWNEDRLTRLLTAIS